MQVTVTIPEEYETDFLKLLNLNPAEIEDPKVAITNHLNYEVDQRIVSYLSQKVAQSVAEEVMKARTATQDKAAAPPD